MLRVVLALLGSALAFAALAYELDLGRNQEDTARAATVMFVCVLGLGYPVLGLFCKRGWWQLWRVVLLGLVSGLLCALPFHGGAFNFDFLLLIYGVAGLGIGVLFWCAAIWRNDDLICPKSFCLPCGVYKVARKALLHRRDIT